MKKIIALMLLFCVYTFGIASIEELSENDLATFITSTDKPIVIYFYYAENASLITAFRELAKDYEDQCIFASLKIYANSKREFFMLRAPYFAFFKKGKLLSTATGYDSKDGLTRWIEKNSHI